MTPADSRPRHTAPQQDVLRGILLMLGTSLVFPVMNAFGKNLNGEYSPVETIWARNLGHFILVVALFWPRFGPRLFLTRHLPAQLMRSVMMVCSTTLFFIAITTVPLADAAAIGFTGPLMVTALSVPLLAEKVGWRRWTAVVVGFVGALIVIRPGGGSGAAQLGAILILASAACYALYQILTRRLAAYDPAETTVTYSVLVGAIVFSAIVPFYWQTPRSLTHVGMFCALGLLGAAGHFLLAKAFMYGPAAVISPFHYAQLIGATALGYFMFGNFPDLWTWVGAAVIVASGLFIAYRETVVKRQ